MCKEDVLSREEIEHKLYQLDGEGKMIASLLIGISDRLDIMIKQNDKLMEQNKK